MTITELNAKFTTGEILARQFAAHNYTCSEDITYIRLDSLLLFIIIMHIACS